MKTKFLKNSSAAIALAVVAVGTTAVHSSSSAEAQYREAASAAAKAGKALAKRDADDAIGFAERAVQFRPQDASYRALLGKAYLLGGRFASARQAFADALSLDAGAPVQLNHALATIATGDYAAAQEILNGSTSIPTADRGLALALAGNPQAGIQLLMEAARSTDATAKTRQNLALALALGGRWPEAHQVAATDLSPAQADARILQWAAFARPAAASDQVATLLGVRAAADQGMPVALALVGAPQQVAEATPAPAPAPAQESEPVEVATVTVEEAAPAAVPAPAYPAAAEASPASAASAVSFAERREILGALPAERAVRAPRTIRYAKSAPLLAEPTAPAKVAAAAPQAYGNGNFQVQIGAFAGQGNARAGWHRASARFAGLRGKTPQTMAIGNGLIRVSVGGYSRAGAVQLCRSVRASGGACFVRANAGDRVASWAKRGVQVASR